MEVFVSSFICVYSEMPCKCVSLADKSRITDILGHEGRSLSSDILLLKLTIKVMLPETYCGPCTVLTGLQGLCYNLYNIVMKENSIIFIFKQKQVQHRELVDRQQLSEPQLDVRTTNFEFNDYF